LGIYSSVSLSFNSYMYIFAFRQSNSRFNLSEGTLVHCHLRVRQSFTGIEFEYQLSCTSSLPCRLLHRILNPINILLYYSQHGIDRLRIQKPNFQRLEH
jgi:hypothetical protein